MSAGTPVYGTTGNVKIGATDLEITKFSYKDTADTHSWGSSKSGGRKLTIPGNAVASGSVEGKVTTEQASLQLAAAGGVVSLTLGWGSMSRIFSAVISNVNIDVDVDSGAPVGFSFDYVSSGDITADNTT